MSRFTHIALSVDVDRFKDSYLRKHLCQPGVFLDGKTPTVESLRIACAKARAEGKRVLPPCDHTAPDGSCLGHEKP